MKQLFLLGIIAVIVSCGTSRQVGGLNIALVSLPQYHIKNSLITNSYFTAFAVQSEANFNDLFYNDDSYAPTAMKPDFSKQMVVALASRAKGGSETIRFAKATVSGNRMSLLCVSETSTNAFNTVPVAVAAVPAGNSVAYIDFYVKGTLVKTITLSGNNNNIFVNSAAQEEPSGPKVIRRKPVVI